MWILPGLHEDLAGRLWQGPGTPGVRRASQRHPAHQTPAGLRPQEYSSWAKPRKGGLGLPGTPPAQGEVWLPGCSGNLGVKVGIRPVVFSTFPSIISSVPLFFKAHPQGTAAWALLPSLPVQEPRERLCP